MHVLQANSFVRNCYLIKVGLLSLGEHEILCVTGQFHPKHIFVVKTWRDVTLRRFHKQTKTG